MSGKPPEVVVNPPEVVDNRSKLEQQSSPGLALCVQHPGPGSLNVYWCIVFAAVEGLS